VRPQGERPSAARGRAATTAAALRTVAVALDVVVLLIGTFWVWLLLGLAALDSDVADWLPPAVIATGVVAAGTTATVGVRAWRGRPARRLARGIAAAHVTLAACTGVLLHAPLGVAVLVLGACVVAWAGAAPGSQGTPGQPVPPLHRRFRGA
jgi:hypothetical protein